MSRELDAETAERMRQFRAEKARMLQYVRSLEPGYDCLAHLGPVPCYDGCLIGSGIAPDRELALSVVRRIEAAVLGGEARE